MPKVRGDRIRRLRERAQLQQYACAFEAGISQAHLSRIEGGSIESVGSVVLEGLARVLRTSVPYLLGETADPRPVAQLVDAVELSPEEHELVERYRAIRSQELRGAALDSLASLQRWDKRLKQAPEPGDDGLDKGENGGDG